MIRDWWRDRSDAWLRREVATTDAPGSPLVMRECDLGRCELGSAEPPTAETSPSTLAEVAAVRARQARLHAQAIIDRHGQVLWWLHSVYALGLGICVILFAQEGFEHARWLTVSLGVAWIVLVVFFRRFGAGKQQVVTGRRAKVGFYVMTYLLKNMYQGMLFFLLPFYWRAAVWGTPTQWFVLVLAVCAVLSTFDVVFDHVLMRWKTAASIFYLFTLFCCLNLVIPASLPNTRSLVTLLGAALVSTLAFWTMYVPARALTRPTVLLGLLGSLLAAPTVAYLGRAYVPPVAMHVASGAVGPSLLEDGRLAIEASTLHTSLVRDDLHAVTDVMIPGGKGDRLVHVWRKGDAIVQRSSDVDAQPYGKRGMIRLRTKLSAANVPADRVGPWLVDVETADGQLVGRVEFAVIE